MSKRNEQSLSITKNHIMLTWSPHATCNVEMEKEETLQKEDYNVIFLSNNIMILIGIMMLNKPKEAVSCRDNDHRVTTEQCCPTAVPLSIQVFNLF